MEYSTVVPTYGRVSRIGFGCAPMSGYDYGKVNDADLTSAVRRALDLGITFFDTAAVYGFGHAEELLGKALGNDRNKAFIATKFGLKWDQGNRIIKDCSAKNVFKSVDDSLRRLNVDTISLYQIHWPDPETPLQETMEALVECQKTGKIKYIGCSNFGLELIEEMGKWGKIDAIQLPYNLMERSLAEDVLPICRERNLAFLAHSPLARGFLTGKYKIGHYFGESDTRKRCNFFSEENRDMKEQLLATMGKIAIQHNKTISQVAIRWILDNPAVSCAIIGVKNVKQLEENIDSIDWKISPEAFMSLSAQSSKIVRASS